MKNDNIEVSIETRDSRPIRVHHHDGRCYIQSNENAVYQIRVKNKTGERIKAVISVDSLNIVNGKPATNDPAETGYILGAYEDQVFKGFRVDENTVAEFTFTKKEGSYATEVGSGAGNGVIAVRAYEEKESAAAKKLKKMQQQIEELTNRPREKEYIPVRPWYWEENPWYRPRYPRPYYGDIWYGSTIDGSLGGDSTIMHAMGMSNAGINTANNTAEMKATNCMGDPGIVKCSLSSIEESQPFDMGSKWGEAVRESVKEVEFEVGKLIAELSIFYTSLEGLKVLGVNVERVKAVTFPEPFKREFAAPPKGWQSGKR